jgi:hypothetical protein
MYFHYPVEADDGKGFGCVIALLVIERQSWLIDLYEACQTVFGRDEQRPPDNFLPHLSLVYAPESKGRGIKSYVERKQQHQQQQQQELPDEWEFDDCDEEQQPSVAKYLSMWSTQGTIDQWYRIAKIELL